MIHPTAIVHPNSNIASTVTVGPYAIIEDDVVIGENSIIESQVRIAPGSRIGQHCVIHFGAVIGTNPQSISFDTMIKTFVEIGDNSEVWEFCTVNRGTTESYTTRVGQHCQLHSYSHIAHDCQLGNHVTIGCFVQLGGHVHIGDHSILRPSFPIHQFTHIGKYCDKAGPIRKDVPPFVRCERITGNVEGVNLEKLLAEKFDEHLIREIVHAYEIIYNSGLNVTQALDRITNEMEMTESIQEIYSFIKSSKRGIVRGLKQ